MDYFSIDYSEINQTVQNLLQKKTVPSFSELVSAFFRGEFSFSDFLENTFSLLKDDVLYGFFDTKELLVTASAASVFFLLSKLSKKGQAAETSFFVTYLILISGMTRIFLTSRGIIDGALFRLVQMMESLMPVFTAGMAFSSGTLSALMVNQMTVLSIYIASRVFQNVILPLISVYFLISLLSQVIKEDILSRATGILYSVVCFFMRGAVGFVITVGALRGMIAPAADAVKRSAVLKAAGAVPMLGDIFDGAAKTVLSAGVLLKNSIGVAGVIILFLLCLTPFLQVFIATVSLQVGSALLQPFSDKRLTDCFFLASKSHRLLLRLLLYVFLMFLFLILALSMLTGRAGG